MALSSIIQARYQIVTPLMLGGANHAAEFRLASFLPQVRWWWRFLALGRYGDEAVSGFWEAVLFGWPAEPFGQKLFSARLVNMDAGLPAPWQDGLKADAWSGIQYLTAQGFKDGRTPVSINGFAVEIRLRDPDIEGFEAFCDRLPVTDRDFLQDRLIKWGAEWRQCRQLLLDALALIGLLGGLGARSRRGFGSLSVLGLRDGEHEIISGLPADVTGYRAQVARTLGTEKWQGTPPFTAWSSLAAVDICASGPDVRMLMNEIGWAMQLYRSWGQKDKKEGGHRHELSIKGQILATEKGGAAKNNYRFKSDHNEFYAKDFPSSKNDVRAIFGLPHNYGSTNVGWANNAAGTGELGRRASPLLLHFHTLADGRHVAVASVFPAPLAPANARLVAKTPQKQGNPPSTTARPIQTNPDWHLLREFAHFIREPDAELRGGAGGGVIHSSYTVIPAPVGSVK